MRGAIVSGPGRCRRFGNSDARCVGPQPLQVIYGPCLLVEQMDDEVTVIKENPLAVFDTLTSQGALPDRLELTFDLVDEAAQMRTRRAGCDHKQVGYDEELGDIEDGGVFTLMVNDGCHRFSCGFDSFFGGGDAGSSSVSYQPDTRATPLSQRPYRSLSTTYRHTASLTRNRTELPARTRSRTNVPEMSSSGMSSQVNSVSTARSTIERSTPGRGATAIFARFTTSAP